MLFNVTSWDTFPKTFTFSAFQAEGSCYLFSKQTLDIKEKVFQLCHESAIFAPHPIKAGYIISVSENKMYSVYKWWNRERNHDSSIKWVLSLGVCSYITIFFLHNHFFRNVRSILLFIFISKKLSRSIILSQNEKSYFQHATIE